MGYYFSTNHTNYTIQQTTDPSRVLISGGQFHKNEIYKPAGMIGEGMSFQSILTDSPVNGDWRGKSFHTSTIRSIHTFSESQADMAANTADLRAKEQQILQRRNQRVEQAERLYGQVDGQQSDFEY